MATKLSELTRTHNNNFTLICFIAATMVLYSHMFTLIGEKYHPYAKQFGLTLGVVGVDIFFFTSGFLVTASLIIRKDIFAFAWARFLRIYPALFFAVIVSILIGLYFTTLSIEDFFKHSLVHRFFIHNITLYDGITYFLPGGIFSENLRHGVNGSLWTLPWEIKMYMILFILGIFIYIKPKLLNKKTLIIIFSLIVFVFLSLLYVNRFYHFTTDVSITPALRFLPLFFMGSLLYIIKDKLILSTRFFLFLVFVIIMSAGNAKFYYILHYLFIGYIILYLAYIPKGKIRNFNKLGDYSYGLYIFAYPIQQSVIALNPNISGLNAFYISLILTLILSVLSWHLLEKKMLTFKNSYFTFKDKYFTKHREINE